MFPILFKIGDVSIPSFYAMMLLASIVTTLFLIYYAKRAGLSPAIAVDIGIIGTLTGIAGARIFHILVEYPWYYWENPSHIWQLWRGGLVWYGGPMLAAPAIVAYLKFRKQALLPYFDCLAAALPIVLVFGRIGCFSVGCCYGQPTYVPWGMVFPPTSEAGRQFPGLPLHPTQLYELAFTILMSGAMFWVERHKRFLGESVALYLLFYPVGRTVIEIFRGDADRGLFGGISTSQIVSGIAFSLGLFLYRYYKRRGAR